MAPAVPVDPALVHWRGRRLYEPRPVPPGSVRRVWTGGGVLLTLLLNRRNLGRLPMPRRTRLAVEAAGAVAAVVVVAVAAAGRALAVDGGGGPWGAVVLGLIASRIAGPALYLVFGRALRRAYRHLELWGGRTGPAPASLLVTASAGLAAEAALLVPVVLVAGIAA